MNRGWWKFKCLFVKCVLFVSIGCWPQYSRLGPALPKIGKHFTASVLETKPLPEMLFQLFVFFKPYICLFAIAYFSEQPKEKTGVVVLLIEEIYGGILWDILKLKIVFTITQNLLQTFRSHSWRPQTLEGLLLPSMWQA